MTNLQAAILGVIQGLTEFLPVSSSGHLILVRDVLGWQGLGNSHLSKSFDVALHFGTFLGVAGYFWGDIGRLARAWWASLRERAIGEDGERKLAWLVLVSMVPAGAAGLAGQEFIERQLGTPLLVSGLLVGFGLLLWAAEAWGRKLRGMETCGWWDAVTVGVAQAVALAPGVSRSGVTITVGLFRGLTRQGAARFAFLISVPIIGGTALHEGLHLLAHPLPPGLPGPFAVGVVSAAVSGYLCIKYFLGYLQRYSFRPFIWYRLALGAGLIVFYLRQGAIG